jgi:biopolymer transport protein ExbB
VFGVIDYISSAGAIGWPIVGLSVILWGLLGYRWSLLKIPKGYSPERPDAFKIKGDPGTQFELLLTEARELLLAETVTLKQFNVRMNEFLQSAKAGSSIVNSIVAVAPLMGLLGTVAGMIVTFRSMESMALFSQGGGIAGGFHKL